MATFTAGYAFGATETVTNTKLGLLISAATVTAIVNADVDAGAAIGNAKLNLASIAQAVIFAGGVTMSATAFKSAVATLTDGATPALDASLGNTFVLTAAGNRTIAVPSNAVSAQRIVIRHEASGGARTLALNTGAGGFRFGEDITALTATTSGKSDYIGCIYDATDSFWDVVSVIKGY